MHSLSQWFPEPLFWVGLKPFVMFQSSLVLHQETFPLNTHMFLFQYQNPKKGKTKIAILLIIWEYQ